MPRLRGGHIEYLPLGTTKRSDNQNGVEKPDAMTMTGRWIAAIAVILGLFCIGVQIGMWWIR